VASQGGLHGGKLIDRDVTGVVFAILPMLEFMVRAGDAGTLFEGVGGEFTAFHGRNGGDLLKDLLFMEIIHYVTRNLVTLAQKTSSSSPLEEFCLTPQPLFASIWELTSAIGIGLTQS
jgi:hypothetical protein